MMAKKIPPISVYLDQKERAELLSFIHSFACFNPSSFGRQCMFLGKKLIEKHGLDPRTLMPKGY